MGIFDKAIISLTLVLLNTSFNVLPKWYCHSSIKQCAVGTR